MLNSLLATESGFEEGRVAPVVQDFAFIFRSELDILLSQLPTTGEDETRGAIERLKKVFSDPAIPEAIFTRQTPVDPEHHLTQAWSRLSREAEEDGDS